ncbi:MAG TPA: hypothetical protein VK988_04380 [Acidimicrobiales bacterium]|nr:hypothetical protein [Acidimicrobiales bacterium]
MTGCQVDGELPPRLVEVRHTVSACAPTPCTSTVRPSAVTQAVAELADWVLSRVA